MATTWIRAKFFEVYQKLNPVAKHLKDKIYLNGEDNLYPNTLLNIINESSTAKRCSNLMAKFIVGKGVINDIDITKTFTLNDFSSQISRQIATYYGAYVWIGYGFDDAGKIIKKSYKVFDYSKCRTQIKDADFNEGKIIFSDWNGKSGLFGKDKNKTEKWYYPFNDNDAVVRKQIENDFGKPIETEIDLIEAIKKYRGQVYHINLTPEYEYSLPLWDSVFNDMNSEAQISKYTNTQTRSGFVGKTAVITAGLDAETKEVINKHLGGFLGAENSSNIWHLSLDANIKIDEAIKIEQVKAQYDEKLFQSTIIALRKNISGAFNNIPEELIYSTGGLFGQSSDKYNEMKKFYWEQNDYERKFLINRLWELGFENVEFIPLFTTEFTDNSVEIRQKAQAELKGSVGGVTALITLQQSVATETTSIESAVEIIKEIYGIEESTARKMLGEIQIDPNAIIPIV